MGKIGRKLLTQVVYILLVIPPFDVRVAINWLAAGKTLIIECISFGDLSPAKLTMNNMIEYKRGFTQIKGLFTTLSRIIH
jgi:hypothetical protein